MRSVKKGAAKQPVILVSRKRAPLLVRLVVRFFVLFGKPLYYFLVFSYLHLWVFWSTHLPRAKSTIKQVNKKKLSVKHLPRPTVYLNQLRKNTPKTFYAAIIVLFMLAAGGAAFYRIILADLPAPQELLNRKPIVTTKIYDRNGVLLYNIFRDQNRTLVPLSDIPMQFRQATIAIEDKDFYSHNGFSVRGIIRALKANIEHKRIEGGSTITQQLVKNTLLTPERTMKRKIKEIVLAVWVETKISKDDILAMYLNEVSYGGSLRGAEAASRAYFGKSVRDLNLGESAFLAGLPQAPSTYSPFGPKPELGFNRQALVLQKMVENGYITADQSAQAQAEQLVFQPDLDDIRAPHFVMYIREILAKKYGEDMVSQGGLEVHTSLDFAVQQQAEQAISTELTRLKGLNVNNGAALITNPQTGEILAMVGSRNYFDVDNDGQVNVTIRPRQPGSSIKPLTYATAMERGLLTPSSLIEDAPITFKNIGSPPYSPKNYDGRFHGRVSVRTALANSYNIPAVKTLASVGVQTVVEKGREMGITTWDEANSSRFGLSLTLGGGEVLMTDMAKVYGTFANRGDTVELDPFLSIKDYKGKEMYHNPCLPDSPNPTECDKRRTLDPRIAAQITSILSDNAARTPAFGARSVLFIPKQEVAVKTGTTNSLRDNWTAGYITNRVVVTWVGNNNNQPMSRVVSGITGASPIWNSIMKAQLDDTKPHTFANPENMVKVKICGATGTLACTGCPNVREELFIPGTEPTSACTPEQFVKETPLPDGSMPPPKVESDRDKILNGVAF